jgi:hypothetical protein
MGNDDNNMSSRTVLNGAADKRPGQSMRRRRGPAETGAHLRNMRDDALGISKSNARRVAAGSRSAG